jgi:hypothetical protein
MSVISMVIFIISTLEADSDAGYRNIENDRSLNFLAFPGVMEGPVNTAAGNIASRLVAIQPFASHLNAEAGTHPSSNHFKSHPPLLRLILRVNINFLKQ